MIAVVTDTCASVPQHLIESLQIEVVPYYIHREGETLRDMIDISPEEFYRWLPTVHKLPTTANPGPGDYLQAFERAAQRASGIVSIHMTSKGSGAYQAGCVAREMAAARLPGDGACARQSSPPTSRMSAPTASHTLDRVLTKVSRAAR